MHGRQNNTGPGRALQKVGGDVPHISEVFTMRFATSDTEPKENPAPQTPPRSKRPRRDPDDPDVYTPPKTPKDPKLDPDSD
jgi:hypothetical protein